MIAAWMLYCVALGALLAGAALLAERMVDRFGGATRRVWAWVMAGAVGGPLLGIVLRDGAPVDEAGLRASADPVGAAVMRTVDTLSAIDGSLVWVWLAASTITVASLLGAFLSTRRDRREWRRATVDGVPVLLSWGVGPAVVGFVRGSIVLPAWALDATPDERTMMLRHEQEHLRAGDPLLGLLGMILVAAMPWSPALWFMAHRLRLAIEVDCDRRVVRGGEVDVRAYGTLLLAVGRRRSALPMAAAAFSRPRSSLEHRIDRMTLARGRVSRWRTAAAGLALAVILAGAWALPQPVRAADVPGAVKQCPPGAPLPPLLRWSSQT